MEPAVGHMCHVAQGLRRAGDVGVSAWYRSVSVVVVHIEENRVQTHSTTRGGLLDVTRHHVRHLVRHSTCEQIDTLYNCGSGSIEMTM